MPTDVLFDWKDVFLTGIESVDQQHHRLVDLINDLAATVMARQHHDSVASIAARDALVDYARSHFADEEGLMGRLGLDRRHVERHVAQHHAFIEEVRYVDVAQSDESMQAILSYLMGWLAHHILGVDQSMARQARARQAGSSAEDAFDADLVSRRTAADPLLDALNVMLHVVSQRNRELRLANLQLEQRVIERTAELQRANQHLHVLALNDELTGLPNRRFAVSALAELWAEACRDETPLSVLMLDADKFKPVNDTYGHAEGDAMLRALAAQLRHAVRTSDIVCRLGGDEFLVICPRSGIQGARQVAAKILVEVTPYRNAAGNVCWNGAISIGAAEILPGMSRPEDLLQAADRALYTAKRSGGKQQA